MCLNTMLYPCYQAVSDISSLTQPVHHNLYLPHQSMHKMQGYKTILSKHKEAVVIILDSPAEGTDIWKWQGC